MIRFATPDDADQIAAIYNYYVDNTHITFEEQAVPDAEMRERITLGLSDYPWLVADDEGMLLGYAFGSQWMRRSGYRNSVETAVYVAKDRMREGLGPKLYSALIEKLKGAGFHCASAGIALPNPASVAFHEKLGFRKVGELQEVGRKFGQWINVGYWELML
jgi:phosphinothricin acetyltransferase